MSSNMQRLGNMLSDRMKRTAGAAIPMSAELGVINGNLSLSVDSLKSPIPKGDYMVNIQLAASSYRTGYVKDHSHDLPSVFRRLSAGDRVLVIWCGNEPVVIARVVGS